MSLTLIIIILTALVSYRCFEDRALFEKLKHSPYLEHNNKEYYRLWTAGFVHGSWMHLIINMFVFYQFGEAVEQNFIYYFGEAKGRIFFLILYLATIPFANLSTLFKHKENGYFASVGASGAVSGILFAYIIFNPWNILLLFFIIPIPAFIAAVLYLVYSSWAGRRGQDMIDHEAHFYGAVFGFALTLIFKPEFFSMFLDRLIHQAPF
ncbi:MAG: rhomboid family intramembrane serine protease [Bacteroidetes bacterium]|nr:rhomboid family intramembrane serine protease [Bacteroidota bacterium]